MKLRFCFLTCILGLLAISITSNRSLAQPFLETKTEQNSKQNTVGESKIVAEVDKIAEQITVLINSEKHGNGSGVIVAKQGNTYYILTASHVVNKEDNYTLVTPDGKQERLKRDRITLLKGVDLALVAFRSDRSYRVAALGAYNLGVDESNWAFLSGFPGAPQTANNPQRRLTAGKVVSKDFGSLRAKDLYSLA
jgi:S1-C subfamily serine protease